MFENDFQLGQKEKKSHLVEADFQNPPISFPRDLNTASPQGGRGCALPTDFGQLGRGGLHPEPDETQSQGTQNIYEIVIRAALPVGRLNSRNEY